MKMQAIVGILVICIGLGCAGLKVNTEEITMEFLIEKSRSCELDSNGWRVLGIPDKDFDNNYIEFVFCTKGLDWGVGFIQQGTSVLTSGSSVLIIYRGDTKQWAFIQNGQGVYITPEDAKVELEAAWKVIKENGDFAKMRTFKILEPIPKESI